VPPVELGLPLVRGELYFFGVYHDYVVAAVAVGAVGWFVLSFEERGDCVGEATDGLGGGVD